MKPLQVLIPLISVLQIATAAPISAAEAIANPVADPTAGAGPAAVADANPGPESEAHAETEPLSEADASRESNSRPLPGSPPARDRSRMVFSRPRKHIPYEDYQNDKGAGDSGVTTPRYGVSLIQKKRFDGAELSIGVERARLQ